MQIFSMKNLVSLIFNLIFLLVLILWISILIRKKAKTDDILIIVLMLVSFFCVMINSIIAESILSFDYMKKLLMFFSTLVFFQCARKINISREYLRFLKILLTFTASIVCFLYIILDKSILYYLNGRVTQYLTFGFTNPNLTALFLFSFAAFQFAMIFCANTMIMRAGHLILALFLSYLVVETQSRNVMLCMIALYFLSIFVIFSRKSKFVLKTWVAFFVTIFPILFSGLYLWFFKTGSLNMFVAFSREGKALDARVSMWNMAFERFQDSPIVGAYSQISYGTGASQMHNTHVDVLASYGIIAFVIFIFWLFGLLINDNKIYTKKSYFYLLCFICCIFTGMGEAALISGGLGIYIFMGMFIFLRNQDDEFSIKGLP